MPHLLTALWQLGCDMCDDTFCNPLNDTAYMTAELLPRTTIKVSGGRSVRRVM